MSFKFGWFVGSLIFKYFYNNASKISKADDYEFKINRQNMMALKTLEPVCLVDIIINMFGGK